MPETTAADPVHLGIPGRMPGDQAGQFECARCDDAFDDLSHLAILDDQLLCSACRKACACRTCHVRLSIEDGDDCATCLERLYVENPVEFQDAIRLGLCNTAVGRGIAQRVYQRGAAAKRDDELTSEQILQHLLDARSPVTRRAWALALYARGKVDGLELLNQPGGIAA